MQNSYNLIISTINTAKIYIHEMKNPDLGAGQKQQILLILILLETIIDKQRTVLPPGTTLKYPELVGSVEFGLNKIRKEISILVKSSDYKQTKDSLFALGEGIKTDFLG